MIEIDITNCARCDGDHKKLKAKVLDNHERYTHWMECPNTKQPILTIIIEDGES